MPTVRERVPGVVICPICGGWTVEEHERRDCIENLLDKLEGMEQDLKFRREQERYNRQHYAKLEELSQELCALFDQSGVITVEAVDGVRLVLMALNAERERVRIAERQNEELRGELLNEDKRNDYLEDQVAELDGDNDQLIAQLGVARGIIRTGLMWCQQGNLVKAAEDLQRGLDEL